MSLGDAILAQQEQIKAWQQDISPKPERRSQSIGKLIEALTKAQLKFEPVKKESNNPFYKSKYADLATAVEATRKYLAENGLAVIQEPQFDGKMAGVTSFLGHTSGEWKEHTLMLPLSKIDAQGIGSAITYARRYSYLAVIGVAAEDDDDANAAVQKTRHYEEIAEQREASAQLSIGQVNAILKACKEGGKTETQLAEYIKAKHAADKLEQLTGTQFQATLKWARSNGNLEEILKTSVKAAKKAKEPEGIPLAWEKKTEITDEDVPF